MRKVSQIWFSYFTFCRLFSILIDGIYPESAIGIARSIGSIIAKMHDAEVVHGDLTTSNIMIVRSSGDASTGKIDNPDDVKVVMIDFGLENMKPIVEDKAVDLYVLERAFVSTHPDSEYLVCEIKSYDLIVDHLIDMICCIDERIGLSHLGRLLVLKCEVQSNSIEA